jgi:hypothetical protein
MRLGSFLNRSLACRRRSDEEGCSILFSWHLQGIGVGALFQFDHPVYFKSNASDHLTFPPL